MHRPRSATLGLAWGYVWIALVLPMPAWAGTMYHVTDIGYLSPVGLDDQGRVYADLVTHDGSFTYLGASIRYDSYGPSAGQYFNVSTNQPLTSANDPSLANPTVVVNSVNSAGQTVVSNSHLGNPGVTYSVTAGTTTTPLPSPPTQNGVESMSPLGVTTSGQVLWSAYSQSSGDPHAVLYDGKTLVDVGSLGSGWTYPVSVNSSGAVIGNSILPHAGYHGFLYQNGTMTDLGTLGGGNSRVRAVNELGQVTGYSDTDHSSMQTSHGFVYANGHMTDLGVLPGKIYSMGLGINNHGEVVGTSGWSNQQSAFLYDGTKMLDLNDYLDPSLKLKLTTALAINDSGQILAQGIYRDGDIPYAILLTPDGMPTPLDPPFHLPETRPLVLFGLLLGGLVARRRAARAPHA